MLLLLLLLLFLMLILGAGGETDRDRENEQGRGRQNLKQDPGTEPDVELKLTKSEITTWAGNRRLTDEPPRCPPAVSFKWKSDHVMPLFTTLGSDSFHSQ